MPLTASEIRAADRAPRTRRKLTDGDGLFAQVTPSGIYWRWKFQHRGREREFPLGKYPEVSLSDARTAHREAHTRLKRDGVDPFEVREAAERERAAARLQELAASMTLERVAREWLERQDWTAGHRRTVELRLGNDVFCPKGAIGDTPVERLSAPEVIECLRRIEARGAYETAKRVRQILSQVCRYAVGAGYASHDPTASLPRDVVRRVAPVRMAHTTDPVRLGEILRAIDGYSGSFAVRCALQLQALTVVRPGELRAAQWSEFDTDGVLWRIPAARMKRSANGDQAVPLVPAALEVIEALRPVTGRDRLLFPGQRSRARPISDVTLNAALRRLDVGADELVCHGWRHVFSTMANESGEFDPDVIEAALHHVDGSVRGRYNSAKRLPERRRLMVWWADRLARFRTGGAAVVPLRAVDASR